MLPEAILVPVGVHQHQGGDGTGIILADQGAFLGKVVQVAEREDRPWHLIGNGPFLGAFQRMVHAAQDYFQILAGSDFIPVHLQVARKGGPARPHQLAE